MWRSTTVTSTGSSHREGRLPCEDEGALLSLPGGILVGAVSDGAGSAKHASQGSVLTTAVALANLKSRLSRFVSDDTQEVHGVFVEVVEEVRRFLSCAAGVEKCELKDFACTLLAFVATPERLVAMQIGDGFIVTRWKESEAYELLFEPQHGEYVNETEFVTDKDAELEVRSGIWKKSPKGVWASTDGLERLALNCSDWTPFNPFFAFFEEEFSKATDIEQFESNLRGFLDSPEVNGRTQDDKTLAMGILMDGPEGEDQ